MTDAHLDGAELRHLTRMGFEFEVVHDGDQDELVSLLANRFERVLFLMGAEADCVGTSWRPVDPDNP